VSRVLRFDRLYRRSAERLGIVPGSDRGRAVARTIVASLDTDELPSPGTVVAAVPPALNRTPVARLMQACAASLCLWAFGACQSGAGDGSDAGTPFSFGATTCKAHQYCVVPCCGGAEVRCVGLDDAGACPDGTVLLGSHSCTNGIGPCIPPPCLVAPPFCIDDPNDARNTECPEMPPLGGNSEIDCLCP
jgi:hypothetical protein